jgi:hypothetical protein
MTDQQTPAPQQTQSSNKGSKTVVTIIIIVVVILAILSIGGYLISRYLLNKVAEQTTESLIEGATGGKVDIDSEGEDVSIETEDGSYSMTGSNEWPSDIPSSVPEFTYGNVAGSSKSSSDGSTSWSITFAEVKSGAYDSYTAELKKAGWGETSNVNSGGSQMVNMENNEYYLIFTCDTNENSGSLIVSSK